MGLAGVGWLRLIAPRLKLAAAAELPKDDPCPPIGLEGLFIAPEEGLDGDFEPPEGVDGPDGETPPAGFPADAPLFGPDGPDGLFGELFWEVPLLPPPTPEAGAEGDLDGPLFGPRGPPGPPPDGFELVRLPPPIVVPVSLPDVTAKEGMPRGPRLMVPSVSTRSISISASLA
jgi:hypothetical protein